MKNIMKTFKQCYVVPVIFILGINRLFERWVYKNMVRQHVSFWKKISIPERVIYFF